MSDANSDAKNTTLLFFLDQLAQGPRSLHDLSCQFGSPHFTNDMKQTVGNNKLGLKRFLLQFPSLFVIDGDDVRIAGADFVAAAGGTTTSGTSGRAASTVAVIMPSVMKTPPPLCKLTPISSQNGSSKRQGSMSSDSSLCSPSRSEENAAARRPPVQHNRSLNADDDAVQFFRRKLESFLLAHPNDEGMTLPSLLGHRSQALPHIRDVCGRNAKELIAFIRRHRDVFLIIPSNDGYGQEITLVQRPKPTTASTLIASNGDSAVSRQSSQPPLTELGLIEFLVNVLRDKGAYFIEQLYGHMNAKFTRDERNEFARNPRELKALIEKYRNVFVINENLVQLEPAAVQSITINGVQKFFASMPRPPVREHDDATSNGHNGLDNGQRADDGDSVSSRDSKTYTQQRIPQITVQKTALEKAIRAAIESNEAHGYSASPPSQIAQDSHRRPALTKQNSVVSQPSMPSNVPWTEVTKVRHMKQIVREIFEVCDKIALNVVLSDNNDDAESTRRTADYVFLVSSHDTAVYGFNVSSSSSGAAAGVACLRDGGLRELLSSDKVTKYSFDAAELGLALVQIFSDDYETLKIKNLSDIAAAEAVSSYFSPVGSGRREKLENSLLSSSSVTDVIEDEYDLDINHDLAQLAEAYAVQKAEKTPSLMGRLRPEDRIFHAYREVKAYFPALSDAIHSSFNLRYLPLLQQMACGEQLERLREPLLYALLKEQRDLHVQLDVIHDMMERRAAATNGHTFSSSSGEADDSAPFLARECAIMRRLGQLSSLISQARNERAVKMNLLREEQRRQAAAATVDDSEQASESRAGHAANDDENQDDSIALEGQSGKPVTTSDVACQTVITGDIIAKCLFIAGRAKAVDF